MFLRALALMAALLCAPPAVRGQSLQDCNALASSGDYQGGLACMSRLQARQNQEMAYRQQQIVRQTMDDPDCQAKYARFRARGGQLAYDQYAYLYVATRGFTAEGIAYFQQTEARNHAAEMRAWQGVLDAEAGRGLAQRDMMEGYQRGQYGAGLGLQGRGAYVDPTSNGVVELQNTRPDVPTQDRGTGRWYVMDQRGTYYVQTPGGQWLPMAPAR